MSVPMMPSIKTEVHGFWVKGLGPRPGPIWPGIAEWERNRERNIKNNTNFIAEKG